MLADYLSRSIEVQKWSLQKMWSLQHLPEVENSPHGLSHNRIQQEMCTILLIPEPQPRVSRGCLSPPVDRSPVLRIPSDPAGARGPPEVQEGKVLSNINSAGVATPALVSHAPRSLGGGPSHSPVGARSDHTGHGRLHHPNLQLLHLMV